MDIENDPDDLMIAPEREPSIFDEIEEGRVLSIEEIRGKFADIRTLLQGQIKDGDRERAKYSQAVYERVYDLLLAQTLLTQAERAIDEKFMLQDDRAGLDHVRAEIGRRLDRIRATLDPGEVPGDAD